MVSIIIVNYNGKDTTAKCLKSIVDIGSNEPFEIIVVDNASTDGSKEFLQQEFPKIIFLQQNKNEGFGKANNLGVKAARGEYLLFLNNDTLFIQDIIEKLKQYLESNPNAGVVSPLLLNSDRTFQLSYGKYPSLSNEFFTKREMNKRRNIPSEHSPRSVDWVSFAAVMVSRKAYIQIGGFNERYFMYFEDADLCYRLKKVGWEIIYFPEYAIIHLGGASWSSEITNKIQYEYRHSQLIFYNSHRSIIELFFLRIYIIIKYLLKSLKTNGEKRKITLAIAKLALTYENRS